MTTHISTAVTAGIMPDFAQAGVVLCRTTDFEAADDTIVSGDTLQMVPIPNDARILRIELFYSTLPSGTTAVMLGYGGDPDAFGDSIDMTGNNVKIWPSSILNHPQGLIVGYNHTFTADDTIDLAFNEMDTKLPTLSKIIMSVWYKMTGVLTDEG